MTDTKERCPYQTGDGKCTHKATAPLRTKRKKFCGYSKPEDCDLYCEWFEVVKSSQRALNGELDILEDEGEDEKLLH